MQNSNLTALAALRNLRGKVGKEANKVAMPFASQKKSLITAPDHFLVIGPETDLKSAPDNDTNVPATIHR